MTITDFDGQKPSVGPNVFVAPDAWIIGRVVLEEEVSIFFGSVLRGDLEEIRIGCGSNLQEHCVCHTTTGESACIIGRQVTIGHRVTLHGCRVNDSCIIGMGSTLLDNAVVEENCIIGANSLVTKGMVIPSGHLAMGSPAKVIRPLRHEELHHIALSARTYRELAAKFLENKTLFPLALS